MSGDNSGCGLISWADTPQRDGVGKRIIGDEEVNTVGDPALLESFEPGETGGGESRLKATRVEPGDVRPAKEGPGVLVFPLGDGRWFSLGDVGWEDRVSWVGDRGKKGETGREMGVSGRLLHSALRGRRSVAKEVGLDLALKQNR